MLVLVTCTAALFHAQFPMCMDMHLNSYAQKIIIYECLHGEVFIHIIISNCLMNSCFFCFFFLTVVWLHSQGNILANLL